MSSYFALLELADGASGEEAVANVVSKEKTEADANPKQKQKPKPKTQEPQLSQYRQHQHVREEYRREDDFRGGRGRGQGPAGGGRQGPPHQGGRGRGYYFNGGNGNGHYEGDGRYCNDNGGYYNDNGGQYHQDVYGGGEYSYGYGGRQREGGNYYNNGESQGYNRDGRHSRRKNLQYRPKEKPASDASDAEHKSEGNVESAGETKQKEANADNVNGVPASESEKSTGDVSKDDSKKEQGEVEGDSKKKEQGGDSEKKEKKPRDPNAPCINGSAKRKLKNKNKQDPKVDVSKKTTGRELETKDANEDDEKEMTLEEYEKMLQEKKSLESSKSEGRKVTAVAFEGLQILGKKKVDDDATKVENVQRKGKEGAVKEVKTRKTISIHELLKPADGQEYVRPRPPRPAGQGYSFSNGYNRGGGGFSGRSRDNSTEPQGDNTGRGDNGRVNHSGDGTNGNCAPRSGYPIRDGGYQERAGNAGYQQCGYNDRGNGGQQGGNGGYRQGGNSERSSYGGNQQSGYSGNGGYRQGSYSECSGNGGNGGHRQGGSYSGNGGYRRGCTRLVVPKPDSVIHFPALTGAAEKKPAPVQPQA